jgi:nucleoside-diphosphate-sugar epimerase
MRKEAAAMHKQTYKQLKSVCVTGGGGYVGAVLVPKLLNAGYNVKVLDLFIYGDHVLDCPLCKKPNLTIIKGDIRDLGAVKKALNECDAVIHLACISNDPSFELDPELGKSINYDAFKSLYDLSLDYGIRRFINVSSSSVYGVKSEPEVTEELSPEPLTDYSRYKVMCEEYLMNRLQADMTSVSIRPATVCGYSSRLRLDLIVNILTSHAVTNGRIRVFGGEQFRPNIHIKDITDLYLKMLDYRNEEIHGKVFNAGYENFTVSHIARMIRGRLEVPGKPIDVIKEESDDQRSYRISSKKIHEELGFAAKFTLLDAVDDLVAAFDHNWIIDPMSNPMYYNLKRMKEIQLK